MRCPYCAAPDSQVKDSRPVEDLAAIKRRRVCNECGQRFTTYERVHLRELVVSKRSGRKVPFDRDKLARSIELALRKRPVAAERIERLISDLVRRLESQNEDEIASDTIGRMVMAALRALDDVAYVRFASVYMNFSEVQEFGTLIADLSAQPLEGDT